MTVRDENRVSGSWLALGTAGISGVAVFLNGYGVRAFGDATAYTAGKNTVAALVLVAVVAALVRARGRTGDRVLTRPQRPGQWAVLGAVGVVGGSVPFVLFFEGLSRATSTEAAFLHKTLVVWVALLAVPLLAERVGVWHLAAIGLLLAGQVALIGGAGALADVGWGAGEVMILAATLCWAVETVVVKRLLGALSSWTVGLARMGFGSVVLLGWVALRGDLGALVSMNAEQLGWVLLTGAILAGYVGTWFAALARAQAVDVTAVLVVGAVVTAALSAVVDGVPLGPQLDGLGLVLAGALLMVAVMRRRAEELAVR